MHPSNAPVVKKFRSGNNVRKLLNYNVAPTMLIGCMCAMANFPLTEMVKVLTVMDMETSSTLTTVGIQRPTLLVLLGDGF